MIAGGGIGPRTPRHLFAHTTDTKRYCIRSPSASHYRETQASAPSIENLRTISNNNERLDLSFGASSLTAAPRSFTMMREQLEPHPRPPQYVIPTQRVNRWYNFTAIKLRISFGESCVVRHLESGD